MVAADYGVNGKWGGLRATAPFIDKFVDTTQDTRWMFYTAGQQKEITSMSTFAHGYANPKFKNKTSTGGTASNNSTSPHTDIDFPLFRLGDERAREMQWEATRRTDLIRFGYFTSGDYVWPFKGGDVTGVALPSYVNLYPIPTADIVLNRNLTQNPGY